MYAFLELIASQQASSVSRAADVVNSVGEVTVSISENGIGEVGVTCGSRYLNYTARSRDGKAIAKGRQVRIVDAAGGSVTVEEIIR